MNGVIKPSFGYTSTALVVPTGLSYEAFCAALQTHEYMGESINWWLGDLLVAGTREHGEDKVIQAISATRKKPDTLDSYRNVSEKIEPARRRQSLSWSAHREVCYLQPAEQDAALDFAETHELSSRQIRKYVRGELFVDEKGHVVESADPLTAQQKADQPLDRDQARVELHELLDRLQLCLAVLGASFAAEILRMRQYGKDGE